MKNENKDLKTLVKICDEKEYEDKKEIIGLKTQPEEVKNVEDTMLEQMREKILECEKLEEVVCLRKKLEKAQRELLLNTPQMKSSRQLDQILNAQISPLIKVGIGYEGETSKSKVEGRYHFCESFNKGK